MKLLQLELPVIIDVGSTGDAWDTFKNCNLDTSFGLQQLCTSLKEDEIHKKNMLDLGMLLHIFVA